MPTYGNLQARNFAFPYPEQMQQQGAVGGGMQEQQAPQMGMETPANLQFVRDTTQGVYDKFYKLKSFVSSMWKNYNIDVTNPDFSDPFSMKANQIYQESIADLKFTADDLANSQRMLERDSAKAGMIKAQGVDLQSQPYSRNVGQAFVSDRGITPRTQYVLEDYQKMFSDRGATEQANKYLQNYKSEIEQDLASAKAQGRQDLVQMLEGDLKAIQGAIYDATKDRDRFSIDSYRKGRLGDDEADYTSVWELLNRTKQGDTSYVEGLVDSKGNQIIENARVNRTKGTLQGEFLVDSKGNREWREIPLDDVTSGLLQLAQRFDPNLKKIDYDVLRGNVQKIQPKGEEEESDIFQKDIALKNQDALAIAISDPKDMNHVDAINALNNFAEQDILRVPDYKGQVVDRKGRAARLRPGDVIVSVKEKSGWLNDPDTFVITVDTGNKLEDIVLKGSENKEFLKELIRNNEVQLELADSPIKISIDENDL